MSRDEMTPTGPTWEPAPIGEGVETTWFDCSVGFTCVCGQDDLQVIEEIEVCPNCKRHYRLVVKFEMLDVHPGLEA